MSKFEKFMEMRGLRTIEGAIIYLTTMTIGYLIILTFLVAGAFFVLTRVFS